MNRRQFLQSLAALGATVALPCQAIATVPEPLFEQAWATALDNPATFYVNEYGALSTDAVETYPATRKELFDFMEVSSREELLSFARDHAGAADYLECEHSDPHWFMFEESVPANWEEWLITADDDTIRELIESMNDWINDTPNELDYERADLSGYSGRGHALRFFRDGFAYCDDFSIVVVEGDCPGSSYFAAELRMDVDTANQLAREFAIPIRFAWQEG